jgi:hypothetical protein
VVPRPRGDDKEHAYTLTAFTTILELGSIKPQGPGGPASSPALLVAPLCKHNGATQYSASSTPVTKPPKIVLYYRLSLSTRTLSNNKELICRFRRVKLGKSHTTGSLICAKPTRRRDQSTPLHYIKVHKFNIITNQVFRT